MLSGFCGGGSLRHFESSNEKCLDPPQTNDPKQLESWLNNAVHPFISNVENMRQSGKADFVNLKHFVRRWQRSERDNTDGVLDEATQTARNVWLISCIIAKKKPEILSLNELFSQHHPFYFEAFRTENMEAIGSAFAEQKPDFDKLSKGLVVSPDDLAKTSLPAAPLTAAILDTILWFRRSYPVVQETLANHKRDN